MFIRTLLVLLAVSPAAFAARNVSISLRQSAEFVRGNNPDLIAARLRIEEAKGRLLGAGRLANPDLGLGLTHDRRFQEATVGVSFDQKFPVTARLRLEKALSSKLVEAAELEVREMEREVIAEAQTLVVKLLAIDSQRTLRKRQTELATKLSAFVTDRSNKGEISPLDAAQAQVDSQRLILEGRKLEAERVSLVGELKPKLGVAAGDTLSVAGELPLTVVPSGASWRQRPDYQLAITNEAAAATGVDLAKSTKWDDITAGAMWEGERMEDAPGGLEKTGFLGLRISIPLPIWNRNQGEIAEKQAAAIRAQLERGALASNIGNQVAAARAEMLANSDLATETREKLLPLVQQQTDRLEKAYETGQVDLLTVLRAREQRLQLESAVLDATRDFHLARIRFEAATGQHAPAAPKAPGSARASK